MHIYIYIYILEYVYIYINTCILYIYDELLLAAELSSDGCAHAPGAMHIGLDIDREI